MAGDRGRRCGLIRAFRETGEMGFPCAAGLEETPADEQAANRNDGRVAYHHDIFSSEYSTINDEQKASVLTG